MIVPENEMNNADGGHESAWTPASHRITRRKLPLHRNPTDRESLKRKFNGDLLIVQRP
jgi:hypothetical protein